MAASMGIAVYPDHGHDVSFLLRRADVAMYVAKRNQSGYALYDPAYDADALRRLTLRNELARAIEAQEIVVYYQPIYSVRKQTTERVEALVRWQHPARGWIVPDEFIPWAEETGQIQPLTLLVLQAAIEQCRVWDDAGKTLGVAVNLSARNLVDRSLVETIMTLLRSSGVRPERLTVEITESALMADPSRAMEILTELHTNGVRISVDDFGTGYSSLTYLRNLPADEVKIDRSFLVDVPGHGGDPVIVKSVIDLGHDLGLEVVAEGVEDQETCQALAFMGCDTIQGFHIAPPMSAGDVIG
jgi:EAL domain-containing protein (putative c-di-GMP-specific phosphodiesterase class I)